MRIREAIRARYVLLPYIYTLFRHANSTGLPVMRPLWYEFPEVQETHAVDDEFLLGPGLLVSTTLVSLSCFFHLVAQALSVKRHFKTCVLHCFRLPLSWSVER